jgi:hypothetical protein
MPNLDFLLFLQKRLGQIAQSLDGGKLADDSIERIPLII